MMTSIKKMLRKKSLMLTIQELFSWLSEAVKLDLTRVGEEALIESIQVLTLAPTFPVPSSSSNPNLFIVSFLWERLRNPPSTPAMDSRTAAFGNSGEFDIDAANAISMTSGPTTFWFVISYLYIFLSKFKGL